VNQNVKETVLEGKWYCLSDFDNYERQEVEVLFFGGAAIVFALLN